MDFLNTITERPAVLIKCIVLILIIAVPAVAFTVRLIKRRAQIYARRRQRKKQKTYSVTVYLGTDSMLRFAPGVENEAGAFVPIQEGVEIPFTNNPCEIGQAYCKARDNSLRHYGEELDMREAPPKYKMFKGFRSQKSFNNNHCCISSFAIDDLKFTYLLWHEKYRGFCSLTDDVEIIETIDVNSDFTTIGNAILKILRMAKSTYPDTPVLCNQINSEIICTSADEIKD